MVVSCCVLNVGSPLLILDKSVVFLVRLCDSWTIWVKTSWWTTFCNRAESNPVQNLCHRPLSRPSHHSLHFRCVSSCTRLGHIVFKKGQRLLEKIICISFRFQWGLLQDCSLLIFWETVDSNTMMSCTWHSQVSHRSPANVLSFGLRNKYDAFQILTGRT